MTPAPKRETRIEDVLAQEMREGALAVGRDGVVRYANRRFAEMAGAPLEQVIGSDLRDWAAEGQEERLEAILRGGAAHMEVGLQTAAGEMPVQLFVKPVVLDGVEVLCCLVTGASEPRRAGDAAQSEALCRAILEQAGEAVVVTDQEGRIVRANAAAHRMAGDSVLFRLFEDSFPLLPAEPDGDIADARSLRIAICAGRTVKALEAWLPGQGDARSSILVSAGPLRHAGDAQGCVITLADVTPLREAENRIRQAQKLESVGLLAGGVAHDFNNLLTGIIGNASMLAERAPDELRASLGEIVEAGLRAADLTRQMLAYAGKGRYTPTQVDISAKVRDTLPLIRTSIPKCADLKLDLHDEPPAVEADPSQIQQVIMNLAINAGEALGHRPGDIRIETCCLALDEEGASAWGAHPGDYVCLRVSDTGCGMDHATLARIFEPFFTTKFIGRGLGLAAVHGIVRSCRGVIRADSVPGEGTCFEVIFPALSRPAWRAPERGAPERYRASGVVLIADDEAVVRNTAALALQHFGFTVVTARDGREAVERFAESPHAFDLVLLDVKMPMMDGCDVFERLKRLRPDVKVLVSSGYNEGDALQGFDASGIAGFLQKPYTASRLAEAVRGALES